MKLFKYVWIFLVFVSTFNLAFAIESDNHKVEIYEDTEFKVVLKDDIENNKANVGDEFTFTLVKPYKVGEKIVLPKGTEFIATVVHTATAGMFSHTGVLKYKIDRIKLLSGEVIPISSKVATLDNLKYRSSFKELGDGGYFDRLGDNFHDNYKYYNNWAYRPEYYGWAYKEENFADQDTYHAGVASAKPTSRGTRPGEVRYGKDSAGRSYRFVWCRFPNPFQWLVILYAGVAKVVRTPIAFVTPVFKKGSDFTLKSNEYKVNVMLRKPIVVPVEKTEKVNSEKEVEALKVNNITK